MPGTIFMVHGMYSGPWVWEKYVPFFRERGWRCVTTTLRHHDIEPGWTPPAELATTSVLDYAADLEAEIRALGEQPVIMGHSMGGLLAQMLAARSLTRRRPHSVPVPVPVPDSCGARVPFGTGNGSGDGNDRTLALTESGLNRLCCVTGRELQPAKW